MGQPRSRASIPGEDKRDFSAKRRPFLVWLPGFLSPGVKRSGVLGVTRWRELVADREKMDGHCSTGQSPQCAVVPMEEEEEHDDDDGRFYESV